MVCINFESYLGELLSIRHLGRCDKCDAKARALVPQHEQQHLKEPLRVDAGCDHVHDGTNSKPVVEQCLPQAHDEVILHDTAALWNLVQQVLYLQALKTQWSPSLSAINGSGPAYLSELLHVYTPSRTLHSSSDTRMLEIQQYKRKTHGFRTFSCFGPHIWNSLPQDLRHCATLSPFKTKLKTFLFSQNFHPN